MDRDHKINFVAL